MGLLLKRGNNIILIQARHVQVGITSVPIRCPTTVFWNKNKIKTQSIEGPIFFFC